jgi:hypothetical protein
MSFPRRDEANMAIVREQHAGPFSRTHALKPRTLAGCKW